MNKSREQLVSKHSYMQRQLRGMKASPGLAVNSGHFLQEMARFFSDFGRQLFLFAGLFLLVAIILAATTGNQTFAHFVAWTGLFGD